MTTTPLPNPLDLLTNDQLFSTQIALDLACGRAKSVLRNKHRTHLCFLATVLDVEANNRDQPKPVPPFSA